jgi:CheY-like chemotaxis protein
VAFNKLDALLGSRGKPSPEATRKAAARPAILVVDDDEGMRASLGLLLGDLYELTLCASGPEGVAAMHDDVCAVILDVKMKGQDGFWACDRIREKHPDVPVIFYSAYQDAKDPYRIINEHRPFAYLPKGSDASRLLKTIEHAVKLYSIALRSRRLLEAHERTAGAAP